MATNGNSQPKITRNQGRVIPFLLSEPDIKSAAQSAGIGERTLHRWLKEDLLFQQALAEAEAAAMAEAGRKLAGAANRAALALAEIIDSPYASNSEVIQAAKALLALGPNFRHQTTLEERISNLERKVNSEQKT